MELMAEYSMIQINTQLSLVLEILKSMISFMYSSFGTLCTLFRRVKRLRRELTCNLENIVDAKVCRSAG
jgi:hypothetical protein